MTYRYFVNYTMHVRMYNDVSFIKPCYTLFMINCNGLYEKSTFNNVSASTRKVTHAYNNKILFHVFFTKLFNVILHDKQEKINIYYNMYKN